MKGLRLGDGLTLPLDFATDTAAIVGMRGAGKSTTGRKMAEEMYANGLPFVVIDPVGKWYGLRSSADGKAPGLPIPILGGNHGDIPLERGAGALVADLIVDSRLSCIIDLWAFASEGDKVHFLTEFTNRLYKRNEEPLHLFLEEADDYIPQDVYAEKARLFRAWENIVRRGRGLGLGCTMITNRTQGLNKAVLEMTGTLISMRMTGPRARKAVEGWFEYHDMKKEVLASLSSLEDGEAWVWSPEALKIMKRVKIDQTWTFDSGATPKVGAKEHRKASTLADVDLAAFQTRMAETIERAKADDPKELRRRVADLERQVAEAKESKPKASMVQVRVPLPVLDDKVADALAATVDTAEGIASKLNDHGTILRSVAEDLANSAEAYLRGAGEVAAQVERALALTREATGQPSEPKQSSNRKPAPHVGSFAPDPKFHRSSGSNSGLRAGQRRLLNVLIRYHPRSLSRREVGMLAGFSAKGGTFSTYIGVLKAQGLIGEAEGFLYATREGLNLADDAISIPKHPAELLDLWSGEVTGKSRLRAGERLMFSTLIEVYPKGMTRAELGDRTKFARHGGTFSTYLGRLKSNYLVREDGGFLRANLEVLG